MLSAITDLGKSIIVKLDQAFYGKTAKEKILSQREEEFKSRCDKILEDLHSKSDGILSILDMNTDSVLAHTSLARLRASTGNPNIQPEILIRTDRQTLLSLAQISFEYGIEKVWEALKQVWRNWKPDESDQPAYVRTILATMTSLSFALRSQINSPECTFLFYSRLSR